MKLPREVGGDRLVLGLCRKWEAASFWKRISQPPNSLCTNRQF